ncbi:unnamed protein product [Prorocentrum cordatum]|uniref:Protein-serine/threonine phosphatase n=1 Tax=Prorocentrum cordatum TaxID=2364126 RepID=A0ABN9TTY1_9DINO|nr:unnamed protein product [Polarella glacialis]
MKTNIVVHRDGTSVCCSHSLRMLVNLSSNASDICSRAQGWSASHPNPVRLPKLLSTERTCRTEVGSKPASVAHAAAGDSDSRAALDQSGSIFSQDGLSRCRTHLCQGVRVPSRINLCATRPVSARAEAQNSRHAADFADASALRRCCNSSSSPSNQAARGLLRSEPEPPVEVQNGQGLCFGKRSGQLDLPGLLDQALLPSLHFRQGALDQAGPLRAAPDMPGARRLDAAGADQHCIRGMLRKEPERRLGAGMHGFEAIKTHDFFSVADGEGSLFDRTIGIEAAKLARRTSPRGRSTATPTR